MSGRANAKAREKALANRVLKGYPKRETGLCEQAGRAGTALLTPPCTVADAIAFLRPRPAANGTGSTVIWRQSPATGPQRVSRRKQVFAWLHPPLLVCAVPAHRPEGVGVMLS